jgi:nitroreductase
MAVMARELCRYLNCALGSTIQLCRGAVANAIAPRPELLGIWPDERIEKMTEKTASPDHPIHALIAERWSPYAFADRPVPAAELRSLFEAARWAASSYNEQPWRYIVATRDDAAAFQRLLSCLVEANQGWAQAAPVLALGVVGLHFGRNGKPNRAAAHDLGLAVGNLSLEATARGLFVHQMIGILPDRARELDGIPEGFEALTALAIGYRGEVAELPEALRGRDTTPRQRRPLSEFVFGGEWESPAPLTQEGGI